MLTPVEAPGTSTLVLATVSFTVWAPLFPLMQ
jgi:hypothetical protein